MESTKNTKSIKSTKDILSRVLAVLALLVSICSLSLDLYAYIQSHKEEVKVSLKNDLWMTFDVNFENDKLNSLVANGFKSLDIDDYDLYFVYDLTVYNPSERQIVIVDVSINDAEGNLLDSPTAFDNVTIPGQDIITETFRFYCDWLDSKGIITDKNFERHEYIKEYVVNNFDKWVADGRLSLNSNSERYTANVNLFFWHAYSNYYYEKGLDSDIEFVIETARNNKYSHTISFDASIIETTEQ